jgi:uncharacterized protein (DUF305 family)
MKHGVTLAILLLGALGITASQAADMSMHMHEGPPVPKQYGKQFEKFASEMNAGMAKMMMNMHAPGYTGDPDIDFLEMMIPHHEGAVDMARLVLEHGTDPVTRKLAEEIIGSQRVEIEGMQQRLKNLRQGASRTDPGGYPAYGGTRGAGSSSSNK